MPKYFLLVLGTVWSQLCLTPKPNQHFPYDLERPDRSMTMPALMKEMSGVSTTYSEKYLLSIQDESGILFVIDKDNGSIRRKIAFSDLGDYEDVCGIGKDVYILKSSGTILHVEGVDKRSQKTTSYKNFLNKENDVEGLAYDQANNRLLLACKGSPGKHPRLQNRKAIYAFNLQKMKLDSTPVLSFGFPEVQEYLKKRKNDEETEKMRDFFDPGEEFKFSPSAINIHPKTGNWYLLSAVGNWLMVLSPKGEVIYLEKLKSKSHLQPEGLCFDTQGGMYISNEGGEERPAMLYYYKMQ
jgi:uncharacterized protein YjiK